MLESRNSYGWGYIGSKEKGFEWIIHFDDEWGGCLKSGWIFKTEKAAIADGKKWLKNHPIRSGKVYAIKAEPYHFSY